MNEILTYSQPQPGQPNQLAPHGQYSQLPPPPPSSDPLMGRPVRGRALIASPRDLLYVIFRQKRKVLTFFCAVLALTAAALVMLPNKYRSESKLLVRLGRESVSIDTAAASLNGQIINPIVSRETEIKSELEILRNRALSERVVETLGAAAVLGDRDDGTPVRKGSEPFKQAVLEMERRLDLNIAPDTSILTVGYQSRDPELAQQVVEAYVAAYQQVRATVFRDPNTAKFFEQQQTAAKKALDAIENELRALKDATGVASLDDQRPIIVRRAADLKASVEDLRGQHAANAASIGAIEARLKTVPEMIPLETTSGSANSALDELRKRVTDLKLEEQDALSKFVETSPRVVMIREKIAAAERNLAQIEKTAGEKKMGQNPTFGELQRRLEGERATMASQQAKLHSLEGDLALAQDNLTKFNAVEVKIRELAREAGIAETNFRRYLASYESARVDQAMEAGNVNNISIAQPATRPLMPYSPNRPLLAMLGLFLAATGAIGVAFVAEWMDFNVKRPDDVARLGIDRVVSVPYIAMLDHARLMLEGLNGHGAAQASAARLPSPAMTSMGSATPVRSAATALPGGLGSIVQRSGSVSKNIGKSVSRAIFGAAPKRRGHVVHPLDVMSSTKRSDHDDSDQNAKQTTSYNGGHGGAQHDIDDAEEIDTGLSFIDTPDVSPEHESSNAAQHAPIDAEYDTHDGRGKWNTELYISAREVFDRLVLDAMRDAQGAVASPRVIGVIGCRAGQGGSTIAAHLAAAVAELLNSLVDPTPADHVLLVDADVQHPSAHKIGGVKIAPGVGYWLGHGNEPDARLERLAQATERPRLSVLSAGWPSRSVLLPDRLRLLLDTAVQRYSHVIVDLPPIADSASAARLASTCDAVLLVIESGGMHSEAAKQSIRRLQDAGAHVLGVVLNKRRFPVPDWLYHRS